MTRSQNANFGSWCMTRYSGSSCLDVRSQGAQRLKRLGRFIFIRLETDPVLLRDSHGQLESVDRIEVQPFSEKRSIGVDLLGHNISQIKRIYNEMSQFAEQFVHTG